MQISNRLNTLRVFGIVLLLILTITLYISEKLNSGVYAPLLLLWCVIVIYEYYEYHEWLNRKKPTTSAPEETTELPSLPAVDGLGCRLLLDKINMKLIVEGNDIPLSRQYYLLMASFLYADEYFLSNEDIATTLGWNMNDYGIAKRRRVVISQLRKLFQENNVEIAVTSCRNNREEQGYRLCLYNCSEEFSFQSEEKMYLHHSYTATYN